MRITLRLFLIAALCIWTGAPALLFGGNGIRDNVVKIYVTSREYDYFNPWQVQGRYTAEGSGAIINGEYILTSAHLVSGSTFIQVKRTGQTKKYLAKVLFTAHDSDLAVIKVNNRSFYPESEPFQVGELARVGDEIAVYGYPNWNEQLTVTKGIVSRVSHDHYVHSNMSLLTCQIDAAINPGNSGGPVIAAGRLVGVAMQMGQGENEGYIVPVPVVEHFLNDIEDGRYNGIPDLGLRYQTMESDDLRSYFGMDEYQSGILVRHVPPRSPARGFLLADDVVLSIDGVPVANDGTVPFREDERTLFNHIVQQHQYGETIRVRVLRNRKILSMEVPLTRNTGSQARMEIEGPDVEPTYFVFAGFIFMPLTENLLYSFGGWYDAPLNLAYNYYFGKPKADDQIVIIMDILSDEVNAGYENYYYEIVSRVNGRPIRRIEDIITAVKVNRDPFHVIETDLGDKIILSRKKVRSARNRILRTYEIAHDRSKNLR